MKKFLSWIFKPIKPKSSEIVADFSDGYHTMQALYDQRLYLSVALFNAYKNQAWKSRRHDDGELCFDGDWFIVGIRTAEGDYTYHYENRYWDLFDIPELEKAPKWDGHTDADCERLLYLDLTKE